MGMHQESHVESSETLPHGVIATSTSAQMFSTSSLDALQGEESRKVMDIVDRLRRGGLSGELQLPQVVVCGDQSSGKSSVLEAMTEIPFPRKENLCTRFATEIILRRALTVSISTKIIPDKQRPAMERKRLEAFKSSIVDFNELPTLIDEATGLMGLDDDDSNQARAFSRDVLSIEIAGPNRPHLTLVDLPGLIHAENKMQSKEDVELIRSLVDDYIKEKRTIIMAVVSAKNDYANQIILKKCRDFDPQGHRTLGIITKPDFLEPDSDNEKSWIELANNQDIFFQLGWHILKNRSDREALTSFKDRNAAEKAFFSRGKYRDLSPDMLGIKSLCSRLSHLLFKHLKTELPDLQKDLDKNHQEVCRTLELIGERRSTPQEQRRFLLTIVTNYQDIVKAGVSGQYEHEFFGDTDPEEAVEHEANAHHLRAVAQHFNLQFALAMRKYGHKTEVLADDGDSTDATDSDEAEIDEAEIDECYRQFAVTQEQVSRDDAIQRVRKILIRSRGRELPGTFNPILISKLFWEQSANWQAIANQHIEQVARLCSNFARAAISFSVSNDISARLQSLTLDKGLDLRMTRAKEELAQIVDDTKHHPITYNPAYISTVQSTKYEKLSSKFNSMATDSKEQIYNKTTGTYNTYLKPEFTTSIIRNFTEMDMDRVSAEDALDSQQAYYMEEVEYFIAAVAKQVIERYLVRDLADTRSPIMVGDMSDAEVAFVAAEPEETKRQRDHLEARKATQEEGQEIFKSALGFFK
ncbi:hypothetical protein M409DRAFT_61405 [Zasmidium cellare ATCC 36951]|uniref:GED domain-containing protein n=1 Tax=Zasmidium cellare ATCC 36951 TaxID=1080233 RepID=A0A6A6BVC7_ZASCE|nr:uncharacterized protein M409DRAFT_61405 [Zasmidium cellare ATCC 36951]KAF2158747.1 hypothetical protein M409DRAFT_61405 [Zasmidium cellare ATCC 36951]